MARPRVCTTDKVDGWQTLAIKPMSQPMDLAICTNALLKFSCHALA
jgi:hypothetical protein